MAGIAIVLDILRKHPSFTGQALHSHGVFSAKLAASAAAASVAASYPFASRAFFGGFVGETLYWGGNVPSLIAVCGE
ncbi:hypothetical protein HAX54_039448 [Datura stramonium]|uniref:Uncharacterized protein n=1 Tax=Datura stramonium TaxID=4076 RepID=A0ABS8VQI8_DATST|nr:hypothetical protein [Datura stramonium]